MNRPVCPACGAAYYSNMFCIGCLNWHVDTDPHPERVDIVRRLRESVMKRATIVVRTHVPEKD